jgi:hypothetical protein
VDRLAFNFTTMDEAGQTSHSIAVYLRRDRFLVGLYFAQPDTVQPPIDGQTSIAGIVDHFERRLARVAAPVNHA